MNKRLFDIAFSIAGLIILSPLFLILALIIKLDSEGNVFFRQKRVGKNGKLFRIFKFRTMQTVQAKDSSKITIGKDTRITNIGHFLRASKLDELPQLINILHGEMSFVGPRPEVPEYVKYYSDHDRRIVLSVRPGITDIASIKFKNENEILGREANPQQAYIEKILQKKLRYCRFYVKNQSLCGDVVIILKTIGAVL